VSHSRAAGFTLLEILVAVFIMAMVLTFAFQAYQGIEHAYSRVGSTPSRDRAARIVLDRLERELVGSGRRAPIPCSTRSSSSARRSPTPSRKETLCAS